MTEQTHYHAALITGAAKRLGRAMALHCAGRGIAVAIHYNTSKAEAQAVLAEVIAAGGSGVVLHADLADVADTQTLIPRAVEALGALDVLINNAAVFDYDSLASATPESWQHHIGINLHAPFILTQEFAKQTKAHPKIKGAIINIIDQRVRKLTPEFMTYSVSKAALWHLTQTSAQALAPHLRVNAIAPGSTIKATRQSTAHFDAQRKNSLLQRGAEPSDILAALDYLLDAQAVTGQLICVDGGQHLGWRTADIIND